ncbi:MAG: flagellar filament capping protein FliD [Planctomycetaceae bacterium]
MLSIDGLVTGIDTTSIIEGLLSIQQQQIERLEARRQESQLKQASVQTLEARLSGLQGAISRLARSANNPLTQRTVSVSDEDAIVATAISTADAGSYDLTVNSLAQSHQIASQGFADAEAVVAHGTLTLRSGSQPPKTITVDSSNDTLQGLADAINGAGAGVSATIVNDGGGGATPFRLLLTANQTGADSAISVTSGFGGGGTEPVFDTGNPVQEARNASITLGSGAGAITVESATNEFRNVIAGVTFSVVQADPAKVVRLNVQQDVATAQSAIEDFVTSFNETLDYIATQVAYNAETDQAGPLLGQRAITDTQAQLRSIVGEVVPGANGLLNRLSALGIRFDDKARLELDSGRLNDVLSGRVPGVTRNDVQRLFALDGSSTNPGIRFLLGSSRTQASEAPYEVDITQAAEQATLTAGTALAANTTIDGTNNTLSLTIDGKAIEVILEAGDYAPQELADELERATNAHPDLQGRELRVSLTGDDRLTLTSLAYGSASQVAIDDGNAMTALGVTQGQSDTGVDVAGNFIVNGQVETAVGRGRVLTGDSENDHTADLQVRVTLTAGQVATGAEGELNITRGLAMRLSDTLQGLLDPQDGRMRTVTRQFEQTAEGFSKAIDRQNAAFEKQRESLLREFAAMEAAMSQLQSTASFLGSQLAALPSVGTSR